MGNSYRDAPSRRWYNSSYMWRLLTHSERAVIPTLLHNWWPEDIFNRLYGSKCFSKMDLKDANLQIPLDPESSSLTTITTPFGVIPVQLSSSRSHCFTGYIPECYQFNRHRCWWCRGVPRWHNRSWSGKVFTWCQTTFTLWEVLSVQCACQSW